MQNVLSAIGFYYAVVKNIKGIMIILRKFNAYYSPKVNCERFRHLCPGP